MNSDISNCILDGEMALRFFFAHPGENQKLFFDNRFAELLYGFLHSGNSENLEKSFFNVSAVDYLNELCRLTNNSDDFKNILFGKIFDVLVSYKIFPQDLLQKNFSDRIVFFLEKIKTLCCACKTVVAHLPKNEKSFLLQDAEKLFDSLPDNKLPNCYVANYLLQGDKFSVAKTFSYHNKKFEAVTSMAEKDIKKFFGFHGIRNIFQDHFKKFNDKISNVPILISSLPGYGKTSMVISYALSIPNTVLILPEPEALGKNWKLLFDELKQRTDKNFVIFFDDVDPRDVDWYNFRTNVGGAFSLPDNILLVLSSNYEFPASILSRGRQVTYPVFDELRCTEMIEDFLLDFGLHHPPCNLVNLIGADYTEEFGQKKFTELSPRTLMRYLRIYQSNPQKRKTMVEMSMGQIITKPVGELFYEFNIELMRTLYGEEYIKKILKEKLRNL